jgi:hypothetical protein
VRDMKGMNASQLAQERAQAALRLYMEDLQNKQRDKELADRKTAEEKGLKSIKTTAFRQGVAGKYKVVTDDIKQLKEAGRLLGDKEKRPAALTTIGSLLSLDEKTVQNLPTDAVQNLVNEKLNEYKEIQQGHSTIVQALGKREMAQGDITPVEQQILDLTEQGITPRVSSDSPFGQVDGLEPTDLTPSEMDKTLSTLGMQKEFAAFVKEYVAAEDKNLIWDTAATDVIEDKLLKGKIGELTAAEKLAIKPAITKFWTGDAYNRYQTALTQAKSIEELRAISPRLYVNVKGFGASK